MQADDFPISPLAHDGERFERIEVTEVIDPSDIRVIRILNPFDPREREHASMRWEPGNTLRDYLPADERHSIASVNGKIVPQEEFSITYLERGDNVVICPMPEGGGGGSSKGILSMIAMIALTVVSGGAAAALYGAIGGTFVAADAGLVIAAMQVGITVAGSVLINAAMAPPKPAASSDLSGGATYGIDGAKNTSAEGVPVPVTYGRFRTGGNIVQSYTLNDGDNQILYMLLNAGEGPIATPTDLMVNDQPLTSYAGTDFMIRLGTSVQDVIPWFENSIVPQNKNVKLSTDWLTHTTETAVDKIRIDLVAPGGLYYVGAGGGDPGLYMVGITVEIKKHSDTVWQPATVETVVGDWRTVYLDQSIIPGNYFLVTGGQWYRQDGTAATPVDSPDLVWKYADTNEPISASDFGLMSQVVDPLMGVSIKQLTQNSDGSWTERPQVTSSVPSYDPSAGNLYEQVLQHGQADGAAIIMTGRKKTAVRRSITTLKLDRDVYDIRIMRNKPELAQTHTGKDQIMDMIQVSDINEILLDPVSYPFTGLVGVRITLGDQISSIPTITYLHQGKLISVWGDPSGGSGTAQWYQTNSANPAWIVWDMLTNKRYGAAVPSTLLDFVGFKRWAAYCDDNGLEFHGVFDTTMNVWDASQMVLRCGHAQLVNVGTRFGVVVERPDTPVMMFSVANMVEDSYKERWLSLTDRANEIDLTFFDKDDNYKQRTIKVYDPDAIVANAPQRSSAITLYGVTDANRAYQEGVLAMNLNRFLLKTVTFSAPLQAIACTVGDLIYVQHDMPNWAQAGRLEAASTATVLQLDRPVTMAAGKTYKVLVLQDKVSRSSGAITNIAGNTIFLSGFDETLPAKRLVTATHDVGIQEIFAGNVTVDDPSGLRIGDAFTTYDTDVVEERGVVLLAGDSTAITLQSPLSQAPAQFVQWMFGEVDKVKQTFRIKSISGTSELQREITALQYDERIYDNSRFGNATAPDPASNTQIGEINDLEAYEATRIVNSSLVSDVIASWTSPTSGFYQGADIYVAHDDGPFELLMSVQQKFTATVPVIRGEKISIKVVAFDAAGRRAFLGSAPVVSLSVLGEVPNLQVGQVSGASVNWSGRDCRLSWRYNSVTHAYEFGNEPDALGADAGALDPHFKDYEIRVFGFDQDTATEPRRIEHVTDPVYVYTYEKNLSDGLARQVKFEVLMRDQFNNLGDPTILLATNDAPSITGLASTPTWNSVGLGWTYNTDPDFAGVMVWMSQSQADLADITSAAINKFLVYDGPNSQAIVNGIAFDTTYYVRAAAYDVFGKIGLFPSPIITFHTPTMDVNAIAKGVIGESWLLNSLASRIDLVDAPASVAGSVAAQVAAEAQARATGDGQNAADISTTQKRIVSRVNLLPNGGFENGLVGWSATFPTATLVTSYPAYGPCALWFPSSPFTGTALIVSAQFNISAGITYVLTGDSYLAGDAGCICYFDVIGYDAGGNAVYDGPENQITGTHAFSATDVNRTAHAVEVAVPANVVKISVRFVFSGNNITLAGCRQVKLEMGTLPASPYTTEATTQTLATNINQVSTTVAGHTTTIQQQTTSINGLLGQWTVKIDNSGYVTGFGLSSTAGNAAPSSQFAVRADSFVMTMPGYPSVYPFTIGAVNGVPQVMIPSALIGDATIKVAKLGNYICSNNWNGVLDASEYISNYGTAGWAIDKAGHAIFNNVVVRKVIDAYSGQVIPSVASAAWQGNMPDTGGFSTSGSGIYVANPDNGWNAALRLYGAANHAAVPMNQRVRYTADPAHPVTFIISVNAMCDAYMTLWVRFNGGAWFPLFVTDTGGGGDSFGTINYTLTTLDTRVFPAQVFTEWSYIDFAVTGTGDFGPNWSAADRYQFYNNAKRYLNFVNFTINTVNV